MPDVNGSHFHLISGPRDWRPLTAGAAEMHYDGTAGGVTLMPRLFRFPERGVADAPDLAARRGAGRDCYGNLYVIGEDERSVRIFPAGLARGGPYWPPQVDPCAHAEDALFKPVADSGPDSVPQLRGLAVTALNYLVLGTLDPAGLIVIDLHGGGPAERVLWPQGVPFAPFDMFPAPDGGLWVLDRDGPDGQSRWWRLNRWFQPTGGTETELTPAETDAFKPVGGVPASRPSVTFPTGFAIPLAGFDARAIVGLADETVLILGFEAGSEIDSVLRLDASGLLARVPLDAAVLDGLLPDAPGLAALDMGLAGQKDGAGTLRLLAEDGNQAFDLAFEAAPVAEGGGLRLHLLPRYYPVRGFAGRGLVEAGEETLYDLATRYVPLTAQPRRRYLSDGVLDGIVLDSEATGTIWHRIAFDACIPNDTAVLIETRTAADASELELADWQAQPKPHLRRDGADLPFHDPFPDGAARGAGVWDLLLQRQVGRWIELRLTLKGSGHASPLIRAMRIWEPRFSYLREYLPALYRQDPEPADFLDRWLANFEGLMTGIEGRVAGAERYFDTRSVPEDALDWLGDWLGVVPGRLSDPARLRLLVANAPLLWDWRGTPLGLLTMLRLALDACVDDSLFDPLRRGDCCPPETPDVPRLIERFLARDFAPVALGDPSTLDQPSLIPADAAYDPSRGPGPLHEAWRGFLTARYGTTAALNAAWQLETGGLAAQQFPALTPKGVSAEATDWLDAGRSAFGFFYPEITGADAAAWRQFLVNRHARIDRLNAAWGRSGADRFADFETVPLFAALPGLRAALADWLDFATRALPLNRAAHRFSVLLPAIPGETPAEMARRAGIAQTVISGERPAHTAFDIRFFWSLFQVGSARLGRDTVVGEGARFNAIVLDRTALGSGHLSPTHPWSVRERAVVGRIPVVEA
jgi:phage tail-like protein